MKENSNHSVKVLTDDVIDSQGALEAFCDRASRASWIAVDTEFERIRTYYPRLCLVQLSTCEQTVCVDPLVGLDLVPLKSLMLQPNLVKVLHAARQDLEVLHRALHLLPAPFFDTQIAAQFSGYGEQPGYADLVRKICEVDLQKRHTRAVWSRRPLQDDEIRYALDDARYLGPVHLYLKRELKRNGREDWLSEECEKLKKAGILDGGMAAAIEKIELGARGLNQVCQSVASSLAVWREQVAQAQDRPREWIVSTNALLQISAALPRTVDELQGTSGLSQSEFKRWGDAITKVVAAGRNAAVDYIPLPRLQRPSTAQRESEQVLWSRLKELCLEAGIPTAAVARRADIRRLVSGREDLSLFHGWRAGFVGRELRELAARESLLSSC